MTERVFITSAFYLQTNDGPEGATWSMCLQVPLI